MSTRSPRIGTPSTRSSRSASAGADGAGSPVDSTTRCHGTSCPCRLITAPTARPEPDPTNSATSPYDITLPGGIRSTAASTRAAYGVGAPPPTGLVARPADRLAGGPDRRPRSRTASRYAGPGPAEAGRPQARPLSTATRSRLPLGGAGREYPGTGTYARPWDRRTSNTVLIVGTTFDPATPYLFARRETQELGRARLLTLDGYGHTSILSSTCIDEKTNNYILTGAVPPAGTVCEPDALPFDTAATTTSAAEQAVLEAVGRS